MAVDVLQSVPQVCRSVRYNTGAEWMTERLKCSRVLGHSGQHVDVVHGLVWVEGYLARKAWPELDAGDLTIHFACNDRCPWAPRPC